MTKRKNKRQGLRSKNARAIKPKRRVPNPVMRVRDDAPTTPTMQFREVASGAPPEGALLLVRLRDGTFRFGMCLNGRFANYEYHANEYVTFAHADRITHWMQVHSPAAQVDEEHEAEFQAAGEAPAIEESAIAAAAEDVYL
jgi:hypothetical protein